MDRNDLDLNPAVESEQSWNAFCKDIWGYLDPSSRDSFMKRSNEFRWEALECTINLDYDRLATLIRAYNWVSPKVQHGETALFFEVAAIEQSLLAAYACANLRLFDQAYKLISVIMEIMDEEFHDRPNITYRLHALGIIADCKWQEPDSNRDKLWSPEWMVGEFRTLSERVFLALEKNSALDPTGNTVDHIQRTGFALLKVAARYLPEELPKLIHAFNSRWGSKLNVEPGHFLTNEPPDNQQLHYWDFEIAKRFLEQKLTLEELDYCHERLIQAAKDEIEGDSKNFLLAMDLQYRYLARTFTGILEFPGKRGG